MGHWRTRFPSKYMQAADLETPIDVTIKEITNETIGTGDRQDLKPVLYLREKNVKGVVMNLTRMEAIEQIAGSSDEDDWPGVKIRLQRGRTKFKGETVACIDVVAPPKARPASTAPPATRPPTRKAPPAPEPEPDDPLPDVAVDDEEGSF